MLIVPPHNYSLNNCEYFESKYRRNCIMNVRQQRIKAVFLLRELAFVLFLLHELDHFTTGLHSKEYHDKNYSSTITAVQNKSLRYSVIPCQLLLLIFLFFIIPVINFLLHELDRKSQQKRQIFEKFLEGEYGWEGHGELPDHRYNGHISSKLTST